MGQYARLISDLKLVKELRKSAGREDISAEDVEKLVALVYEVADTAGPLLERIPATFKQYTEHNILHCRNLLDLMARFIPRETLKELNALELSVLILSALLHDFGMFVSEKEKRDALTSAEFDSFLAGHHDRAAALAEARRDDDHERAEIIQDALLAEYFRRLHPERARKNVRDNLPGKLVFLNMDISDYVLDVCESHAWGVHESNDPKYMHKSVSRLPTNKVVYGVPLNLQYAACCLRLADIMDFDRSRTPLVVFQNIDFTEEKSWEEWNKHLSVKGWVVKENDVMFRAECRKPAYYVAVMEFLDWVDHELGECRRLVAKEAPHEIAGRYKLHLPPVVDRTQVEMEDKNYLAGAFRFQLEYDRIMKLLMDKSLYPDPSLFLRELLQNSLDACRNREAHAKENHAESLYTPRIAVWDYSGDPEDPRIIFQDNGMGMSRRIVENYFMRVGRSYYRSPEFDAERARLKEKRIDLEATSQFGIGILSCFMVADRFEVETYRFGHQPLHLTIEGPTKYFTINLLQEPPHTQFPARPVSDAADGPPGHPGTRVTVHLHADAKVDAFQTLDTFAANVDCDIAVYGDAPPRVIRRLRWDDEETCYATLAESPAEFKPSPAGSKVVDNLRGVLVPSRVPFQKYGFSEQLRGSVWVWLLRGESGTPCLRRGHLFIESHELGLTGLPAFLAEFTHPYHIDFASAGWARFLEALAEAVKSQEQLKRKSPAYQRFKKVVGPHTDPDFIEGWNSLKDGERREVLRYLRGLNDQSQVWYEADGVPEALLKGEKVWLERPVLFDGGVGLESSSHAFALHGIRLPAGFVKWNPMGGEARQVELLNAVGGALLDVRGSESPVPAASRLYVPYDDAHKVALPLLRAWLYHLAELFSVMEDREKRQWLDYFISSLRVLPFGPEVIYQECEFLEREVKYALYAGEREVYEYLNREELIERFGPWVRVPRWNDDPAARGLVYDETINELLTEFKALRDRGDFTEVDLTSKLPFSRDSFLDDDDDEDDDEDDDQTAS